MKKFLPALVVLVISLPLVAQAQQRLTEEQLIARAVEQDTCKGRVPLSAKYDETVANRVIITCGEDAEGFVPLVGLGGLGAGAAGLVLVAAAAGGSSTPSTTGTN